MATSSKIAFFAPDKTILGDLTDWELQTGGNPELSRDRAQALKSDGDELASAQHNAKIQYSLTYKPKRYTGADGLALPAPGSILNGSHVDSVSLAYSQEDFPVLTVSAHRHAAVDGTPESHETCRIYTPAVTLPPRAIGVPSTLKDSSGTTIFSLPAGVGISSLTYSCSATHLDVQDGDGNHLAGENRDGVETIEIGFTGEVYVADLAIDSAWSLPDSWSMSQSNENATTTSLSIQRHIAYTAATGS